MFMRTYHKAQLSQAEDLSEELRRRGGGADAQSLAWWPTEASCLGF